MEYIAGVCIDIGRPDGGRRSAGVGAAAGACSGAGRRRRRVRRREPQERARCNQCPVAEGDRQEGDHLLCGQLGARQADRAGRAGADVHLGRPRLDGLSRAEEPDQAGHALQPARQPHRADRAQGQGAAGRDQAGLRPCQGCSATAAWRWPTSMPCRPANTARRRWRSSACGTACRARSRRPRTCARRCCWSRAARRRSASSTRRTPRPTRSVKIVGTFPEDTHPPIIYPVALTADADASRRRGIPRLTCKSAKAKPLFEAQGFTVLGPGQSDADVGLDE